MKKLFVVFVLLAGLSTMVVSDANARRFGGGSFGRQSLNVGRMSRSPAAAPAQSRQAAPNRQTQQQQQGANAARPGSRFGGMLGGALLGLGLGALLSHMGIGGDMAGMISTILMITLIYFAAKMLFRMFSRKQQQPAYQPPVYPESGYQPQDSGQTPQIGAALSGPAAFEAPQPVSAAMPEAAQPLTWNIPADFDVNAFIRSAKAYYIRMQAAWDKANIDDIHALTTPEMFAEMKLQIQERGASPNVTDVVSIDAELLGIETIGDEYFASVKFSGTVRENGQADLVDFSEVWNLTRPVSGKEGWVLAGVQQLS